MGCSGDREKGAAPLEEQWDYVVSYRRSYAIDDVVKFTDKYLLEPR